MKHDSDLQPTEFFLMSNDPLISFIMICHNNRPYLIEAIQSVLNQSYNNFELIIVDDGSFDGSSTIVRAFDDDRLYYHLQPRQGTAAAANYGLKVARGEYVAFMSGSCVCLERRLVSQLEQINRGFDLIYSIPLLIDINSKELPWDRHPIVYRENFHQTSELFNILFTEGDFLCWQTSFARRDLFLRIGTFDAVFFDQFHYEFLVRACHLSTRVARFNEPLLAYRLPPYQNVPFPSNSERSRGYEDRLLFTKFFDGAPFELLKDAFANDVNLSARERDISVEVDLLFLYLNHSSSLVRSIGLEKLQRSFMDHQLSVEFAGRGFTLDHLRQLMQAT